MPSLTIAALPDNVFPAADATRPLFVSAGYISVDSIIHIDVMPHRGDRVTAERVFKELGGPATNVAVAAAALGGSCALDVELATAIGQDTDSLWALKLLAERGVRARAIRSPEKGRLSRCVVLVEPGGVRTKINEHLDLSDEDLIAHLTTSRSKRARHIHVDGYQVDRMLPAIRDMRMRGWTASSQDTGLSATYGSAAGFAELSREVDYFVLNRKSVARILGSTLPLDGVVTRFNTYLRDTGATAEVVVTPLRRYWS
jgi:ribokinase